MIKLKLKYIIILLIMYSTFPYAQVKDCGLPDNLEEIFDNTPFKEFKQKNINDAKAAYIKAKKGDAASAYGLYANLDIYGKTKKVKEMAKCWLMVADELGYPNATINIAINYERGEEGFPKDIKKSLQWHKKYFKHLSNAKYGKFEKARIAITIGDIYLASDFSERNPTKAFEWYKKAVVAAETPTGEPFNETSQADKDLAYSRLAKAYQYGFGTPVNKEKAQFYFDKIVEGNDNNTTNYIIKAQEYEKNGNYTKAAHFYYLAALRGVPSATQKMNEFYREGKGVAKDIDMANEWLRIYNGTIQGKENNEKTD